MAVSSTLLAIIVQLVPEWGCWVVEGLLGMALQRRMCREAGGRVKTRVLVKNMDLPEPGVADARRLDGTQLAVDTTLVCALHADGTPRRNAALEDGVVQKAAKRKRSMRTQNWWVLTAKHNW